MSTDANEIASLLEAWSRGEMRALDRLVPLVFDDLHTMARRFFLRESNIHTLQPTALVSEVYCKLRGQERVQFETPAEFFGFAAELMRHFLVDYARKKKAVKRGGKESPVSLEAGLENLLSAGSPSSTQIIDLHRALDELAKICPRQARVVELRFFVGLLVEEVADVLDVSEATIKREWRTAKLWLTRQLSQPPPASRLDPDV